MNRVSRGDDCIDEPSLPPPKYAADWVAPEPTEDPYGVEMFAGEMSVLVEQVELQRRWCRGCDSVCVNQEDSCRDSEVQNLNSLLITVRKQWKENMCDESL